MTKPFGTLISATLALGASAALAQDISVAPTVSGGTNKAFEVSLGIGYTQGFGDIGKGTGTIADIGSVGAAAELGLGYRANPNLLVGVYAGASRYVQGNLNRGSVCGYQAGVQGNWHFTPGQKLDPWVGVGGGWRMLCLNEDAGSTTFHGLDVARLQVGVDYQLSPTFAIAPVIGASLNMLLTAKGPLDTSFNNVTDPKLNVFVFGGITGRFDFFGTSEPGIRIASR